MQARSQKKNWNVLVICKLLAFIIWFCFYVFISRHPTLKWAQRADVLFITIDLPDAKNVKLKLEPEGKFYFSATAGAENLPYEIDINLHDKVDVDVSE